MFTPAATSPVDSSYGFNNLKMYDVYLSFCDPHLGQGFSNRLYSGLVAEGIVTWVEGKFIDDIPPFQRIRENVRHQLRLASAQHSGQHLTSEIVGAMQKVSYICGWSSDQYKVFTGIGSQISREDVLMKDVVRDVVKILETYKVHLDTPKCFGLDWRVEHVKGLLNLADREKKIVKVGIHGMPERCQLEDGLVKLQTHMLKDVSRFMAKEDSLPFRDEVEQIDRGKYLLQECLRGKRVLLLLDDIQSAEQLEALGGNYRDFGAGSRLLITSQNQQILKLANVDEMYEAILLHSNFLVKAWLVKTIERAGQGHCYDLLGRNEMELSCVSRTYLSKVLGEQPHKRTRLFHEDDVHHLLRPPWEKAKTVRYLRYEPKERKTVTPGMFMQLYNLRLLWLADVDIKGHFPEALYFDELRWLRLTRCSLTRLPPGMNLNNLVILEVTDSQITHLWDEKTEEYSNTCPEKLKVLILRGCASLEKLPPTIIYNQLQILDLHNCQKLRSLPNNLRNNLGNFHSLVSLNMKGCGVSYLPEDFGMLSSLEELDLSWCKNLCNLPASFGNLTRLEKLEIHHNSNLRELPVTMGGLKSLAYLDAGYCQLCENGLPAGLFELCSLRIIHLEYNRFRSLPGSLQKLSGLWELHVDGCSELSELRAVPLSLEMLFARDSQYSEVAWLVSSRWRAFSLRGPVSAQSNYFLSTIPSRPSLSRVNV
ncbi:hypothetical protein SUGI_0099990 [Cryptomeria japonica]|nr:hypothetical protein SUGI_0099990 [Cryptomeria japonica]